MYSSSLWVNPALFIKDDKVPSSFMFGSKKGRKKNTVVMRGMCDLPPSLDRNTRRRVLKESTCPEQGKQLTTNIMSVGPFTSDVPLKPKQLYYLLNIEHFFTQPRIDRIAKYIFGAKVTLRDISWTVTQYTKETPILLRGVDINAEFSARRKTFGKKYFDLFSKAERVYVTDSKGEKHATSVAQLHVFKFVLETGLIGFIMKRHPLIVAHRKRVESNKTKTKAPEMNCIYGSIEPMKIAGIMRFCDDDGYASSSDEGE